MIPLSSLSEPSDLVAFAGLAVLAAIMVFGRPDRVTRVLIRGRYEFGLIWTLAAALRASQAAHLPLAVAMLKVASATAMILTAGMALNRVLRRG